MGNFEKVKFVKVLVLLVALLAVAIAIAEFSQFNSAAVTLYLANYRIDLSLNLLLLLWLSSLVIVYFLMRLAINLKHLPQTIKRARINRALILSRGYLNAAGLDYFEGNYPSCYKNALKSLNKELKRENKRLAYLLAMRAATLLQDQDKVAKLSSFQLDRVR